MGLGGLSHLIREALAQTSASYGLDLGVKTPACPRVWFPTVHWDVWPPLAPKSIGKGGLFRLFSGRSVRSFVTDLGLEKEKNGVRPHPFSPSSSPDNRVNLRAESPTDQGNRPG